MTHERNYPVATLQEYGYKDYSKFQKPMKVLKHILFFSIFLMLYLAIIVIAIQSVNSSVRTSEFLSITFKWYPNILQEEDLMTAIRNTFIVSFIATSIATIAGTFFAVGLYSLEKKKRQKIMLLNNVPMLNADIVTGFSLMLMFRLLMPIFPSIFGLFTLVMAHLFFTFPYVVLSVMPKLIQT